MMLERLLFQAGGRDAWLSSKSGCEYAKTIFPYKHLLPTARQKAFKNTVTTSPNYFPLGPPWL